MNEKSKKRIKKFLNIEKQPILVSPNGTKIAFARANEEDVNDIEKMTNKELIANTKGIVFMVVGIGQFSIRDLQLEEIYGTEMIDRGLKKELNEIYKHANKIQKEYAM